MDLASLDRCVALVPHIDKISWHQCSIVYSSNSLSDSIARTISHSYISQIFNRFTNAPGTYTFSNMKTSSKNARRKSATVPKARTVNPRQPTITDQKGKKTRAEKAHFSPPHMGEDDYSGDELETVRTGVAWTVAYVSKKARKSYESDSRIELEYEKENRNGSAVKRNFQETITEDACRDLDSSGGEDGKGTYHYKTFFLVGIMLMILEFSGRHLSINVIPQSQENEDRKGTRVSFRDNY